VRRAWKEAEDIHRRLYDERKKLIDQTKTTLDLTAHHYDKNEYDLFKSRKQEVQVLIKTIRHHDDQLQSTNLDSLQRTAEYHEYRAELFKDTKNEALYREKADKLRKTIDQILDGERPFKKATEQGIKQWEETWSQTIDTPLLEHESEEEYEEEYEEADETVRPTATAPGQYPLTPDITAQETPAPTGTKRRTLRELFRPGLLKQQEPPKAPRKDTETPETREL
jgi:hypothetical protein